VRGEGGDGQGEHLVALLQSWDAPVLPALLQAVEMSTSATPPDTSNVSRHTHTCESDTHYLLLDVFLLQSYRNTGACLTA
jgi:hypothetical protein